MIAKFTFFFLTILVVAALPASHGQTLEVLHSFQGTDGANPYGALIAADGVFYGTTVNGGTNQGFGTVFKMKSTGEVSVLVSLNWVNGANPFSTLFKANDGSFYGSTQLGGSNNLGTLFRVTEAGDLSTVFSFDFTNGATPLSGLIQGNNGDFYGSAGSGGIHGEGLIFRINHEGTLTPLLNFDRTNGSGSRTSLMQRSNGDFYGTTQFGGTAGFGTVFKMTAVGAFTTLAEFTQTNGSAPWGDKLVEGLDGNFYGTTLYGGEADLGTVFKMTPSGQITMLISFNGTNGSYPYAGLTLAGDGNFYGVTSQFWPSEDKFPNRGTVFRITEEGVFTTLVTFNGFDGEYPWSALVEGSDMSLYGTTREGGANNLGTIFRVVMPVTLNSQLSGNGLIFSWPTNAVGFTLQSSSDLNSATNWIDITNAPSIVGAQFTVTNSISASAQFFRLKK